MANFCCVISILGCGCICPLSTSPPWGYSPLCSRGLLPGRRRTSWWMRWRTPTSCTGNTACRSSSTSASHRKQPSGGSMAAGGSSGGRSRLWGLKCFIVSKLVLCTDLAEFFPRPILINASQWLWGDWWVISVLGCINQGSRIWPARDHKCS